MKTAVRSHDERVLFRLDFALRGHSAYIQPHDFESLVSLVEHAVLALGAPLLRHLEHQLDSKTAAADDGPGSLAHFPQRRIRSLSIHPPLLTVCNAQGKSHQQHGEIPMSLFNTILEKLGLGHAAATTPTGSSTQQSSAPSNPVSNQASTGAGTSPAKTVDVTAKLDQLAASNTQKLNWKTSIVDLLKLLNLDSSLDARKKLAQELGYTASTEDSAEMNVWLHKQVLKKIADNGGNVPKDLL